MTTVLWNVDLRDWYGWVDMDWLYSTLAQGPMDRVSGGYGENGKSGQEEGMIILQHDIQSHTVQQQAEIIEAIQSAGYMIVSMSECLDIEASLVSLALAKQRKYSSSSTGTSVA